MNGIQPVPLALIRADQRAQPRAAMLKDEIDGYIERISEGDIFPPLTVFFDGDVYWLADGFHRYLAAQGLELSEFACDVRPGGLRDAIYYSCGANAAHGIRRTDDDKRRAVMTILRDPEWRKEPLRAIARHCGVHHKTVQRYYDSLPSGAERQIEKPAERNVTRGSSAPYTQNTSNIGRRPVEWQNNHLTHADERSRERDTREAEQYLKGDRRLFHDLSEMLRRVEAHPDPAAAVRAYSPQLRRAFTSPQLWAFAAWAKAIAVEWQRTEGEFNVAAE